MPQLDTFLSGPGGSNKNMSLQVLLYPNQVIHMKTHIAFQ